jgi:hypothetical protein
MRDRSWGRRNERGYGRIGYVWAASPNVTLLTHSMPTDTTDTIHTGYLRIGDQVAHITGAVVHGEDQDVWPTKDYRIAATTTA